MKRRYLNFLLLIAAMAVFAAVWIVDHARPDVESAVSMDEPPRISPDYADTVIPPNIAPLNFAIREDGTRFFVRIRSQDGDPIEISSRSAEIAIPLRPWRAILDANRGREMRLDVYAQAGGQWRRYRTITNRIAGEEIDRYLAFRRIRPLFSFYRQTGVYQRDLSSYEETPVLDMAALDGGCANCHTFSHGDPGRMCIGVRSPKFGNSVLIAAEGQARKVGTRFGYTAWHPSGRVAAYAIQDTRQFFHSTGRESRDGVDLRSTLAYYLVAAHNVKRVPSVSGAARLESYPAWSPDGRYLYYSSAPVLWKNAKKLPPEHYTEVRYELMRIRYDVETDAWGRPETVLAARETGLSMLGPRISPDGRLLLFCMCRYGCFPPFQPSSDLYLMDLATRKYWKPEINSELSESWHCWSSNGRWIAFSSKRRGGPLTACYLSFVDPSGKAYKPFLLPQSDPAFYDSCIDTVSAPELIAQPVPFSRTVLARTARAAEAEIVDTIADPTPPGALEPWRDDR